MTSLPVSASISVSDRLRLLPLVLLSACMATPDDSGSVLPEAHAAAPWYVYHCDEHTPFTARFSDGQVWLDLGYEQHNLPAQPAASGARYAADDLEFWSRGEQASLRTASGHYQCEGQAAPSPQAAARLRGVTVRAVGQEPGWVLELAPARWMHLRGDYGAFDIITSVPTPYQDGDALVYEAGTGADRLVLRLYPRACQDSMSGEAFALTAEVFARERHFFGCADSW